MLGLDGCEVTRIGSSSADQVGGEVVEAVDCRPLCREQPAAVPDAAGQIRGVGLNMAEEQVLANRPLEVANGVAA